MIKYIIAAIKEKREKIKIKGNNINIFLYTIIPYKQKIKENICKKKNI